MGLWPTKLQQYKPIIFYNRVKKALGFKTTKGIVRAMLTQHLHSKDSWDRKIVENLHAKKVKYKFI